MYYVMKLGDGLLNDGTVLQERGKKANKFTKEGFKIFFLQT